MVTMDSWLGSFAVRTVSSQVFGVLGGGWSSSFTREGAMVAPSCCGRDDGVFDLPGW